MAKNSNIEIRLGALSADALTGLRPFQELIFPDGVSHFEIDTRTHAGKPHIIRARHVLRGVCEHEAIAYCLSYGSSFRIKLDIDPEFHFTGERQLNRNYSDGIVACDIARVTG